MSVIKELWQNLIDALEEVGAIVRFLLGLVALTPSALLRFDLIVQQIFNAGALGTRHPEWTALPTYRFSSPILGQILAWGIRELGWSPESLRSS